MVSRIERLLWLLLLLGAVYAAVGYLRHRLGSLPEETYATTSPLIVLEPRRTLLPASGLWQPLERPYAGFESRYSGFEFDRKEGSIALASTSTGYILYVNSQNQLLRFEQNVPAKVIGPNSVGSVIQMFRVVATDDGNHVLFLLTNKTLTISYDHGDSWADITPKGDNVFQSVAMVPEPNKDELFISAITNDQAFVSADSGRSWMLVQAVQGLGPFHDVEILARPGSIRLFIVGRTGLTSLAWPNGIPQKVKGFSWRRIDAIYKGNLRTTDDQTIYLSTSGVSLGGGVLESLLSLIFGPEVWRLNDSGTSWETLAMPDIFDSYYLYGYTEIIDKKQNVRIALAPLVSGELVISRSDDSKQKWMRFKLPGTKLLFMDTPIGHSGPHVVFGVSTEDELVTINLDKKTWSKVEVPLSTLMSVRVAVIAGKGGRDLITSSRKRLLTSKNDGQSWQLLAVMPEGTEAITFAPSPAYENDEAVYVGTNHGLYIFSSIDRKLSRNDKLGDEAVHAIFFSPLFYTDTSLYVGTGSGIFRSTDGAKDWKKLSNGIGSIEVNSIARSKRGTIFAGTRRGVYLSSDAGDSWVRPQNLLSDKSVLAIAIRDGQQGQGFVLAGAADGAYLSENDGATWKKIDLPTGAMTITSVLFVSEAKDDCAIYLGTIGGGVIMSVDNAKTWQRMPAAEDGLQVWDLALLQQNPLTLLAGTLNRSLWIYREASAPPHSVPPPVLRPR